MTDGVESAVIDLPKLQGAGTDARDIEELPDTVEVTTAPGAGEKKKRDYKAERLRRKLEAGGSATPRKRGRPAGSKNAPRTAEAEPSEGDSASAEEMGAEELKAFSAALALAFRLTSQLVANRRGKHWLMEETESQVLGSTWAVALAPWAPALGKWMPLGTALVVTVGSIAGRLEQDARAVRDLETVK